MAHRYRISGIRLRPGEPKDRLADSIRKKLKRQGRGLRIDDIMLVRESIDARNKADVHFVYTVDFTTDRTLDLPAPPDVRYTPQEPGTERMAGRPVVIGFGPCGMFAALVLARQGYRPIVLERGSRVEERVEKVRKFWKDGVLDPECNAQFGEGGAGTFSDGKLTTGIRDPRIHFVLETFAAAGADPDIVYQHMPHIGTDKLRVVVRNLREEILSLGADILFDTRAERILTEEGRVTGVEAVGRTGETQDRRILRTEAVVLAAGHSSRDTLRTLFSDGIAMEQKPFSIGVRVEHPQALIDRAQYGEFAGHPALPPAVYKLSCHLGNGRGVYTFCMCPGGHVICCASQEGGVVTNGMSFRSRASGTANSALLVDVRTTDFDDPDDPLAGVRFQEEYERRAFRNGGGDYRMPRTDWASFRAEHRSPDAKAVWDSLPAFAAESIREALPILGRKLHGFDSDGTRMTAVESRSSSPVRIVRDPESLESLSTPGLYPGGEGAGYAGGITSSACDGIRIAEKIIARYAPEDLEKPQL